MATTKKSPSASKSGGAHRKSASKRELIDTGRDKRFVRRDEQGQFKEVDDVGRSLSQDRKRKAKTPAKKGQGDKGDRQSSSSSKSKAGSAKRRTSKAKK